MVRTSTVKRSIPSQGDQHDHSTEISDPVEDAVVEATATTDEPADQVEEVEEVEEPTERADVDIQLDPADPLGLDALQSQPDIAVVEEPTVQEFDGLSLDEDPETSMVGSIFLHLLSEHDCYGALSLIDADAIALHQEMHSDMVVGVEASDHAVDDWRFRPARALAVSKRGIERLAINLTQLATTSVTH